MSYVDGFVAAVPTANLEKYREHATQAAEIFRRNGALRTVECWADDVPHGQVTDFYRAVQAKEDETVVFAWIEWTDKAARDAGMEQSFKEMPEDMGEMPFDGKRMIYGSFRTIVDEG